MKAVVLLATGFEEIESVTPIDTLRRAGVEVITVGIGSNKIRGAQDIEIVCDRTLEDFNEKIDCIVIPGGMPGAKNIAESKAALDLITKTYNNGGFIGAICAAPGVVLGKTDILNNKNFTCYPSFEKYVPLGKFSEERVVVDGKIITSRGPGTSLEFSLALVKEVVSDTVCQSLKEGMLVV